MSDEMTTNYNEKWRVEKPGGCKMGKAWATKAGNLLQANTELKEDDAGRDDAGRDDVSNSKGGGSCQGATPGWGSCVGPYTADAAWGHSPLRG